MSINKIAVSGFVRFLKVEWSRCVPATKLNSRYDA
jgi:hypothetical protein